MTKKEPLKVFIGFDPKIADEILGFLLICGMALFYASAQVFSRYLKELDVKFTSASMGFFAFFILLIASIFFRGSSSAKIWMQHVCSRESPRKNKTYVWTCLRRGEAHVLRVHALHRGGW